MTRLLISIGLGIFPLVIGMLSAFMSTNHQWSDELKKPSFQPEPRTFMIAWTILYILMGVAIGLVWYQAQPHQKSLVRWVMILFFIQLFLNALWVPLFFRYHSLEWSYLDMTALVCIVVYLGFQFWKVNRVAAGLFFPYVLWIIFAYVLQSKVLFLNAEKI